MGASAITRFLLLGAACAAGGLLPLTYAAADAPECLGKAVTIAARPGEVVRGTAGRDVILGTMGSDELHGEDGRDYLCGRGGQDFLYGGNGWDTLDGGTGVDLLRGGQGADYFQLSGDGDEVDGGGYRRLDTVSYSAANNAVTVDLQHRTGRVAGHRASDRITAVGKVAGTDFADVLRGDERRNFLLGQYGDDVLVGRGAQDKLLGSRGDDYLSGGPGYDGLEGGGGYDVLDGGAGPDGCTLGERLIDCEFRQLP